MHITLSLFPHAYTLYKPHPLQHALHDNQPLIGAPSNDIGSTTTPSKSAAMVMDRLMVDEGQDRFNLV